MEKINSSKKRITREFLSNPFISEPWQERLKKSEAIILKDNCIIKDLGNDYNCIIPINKNKKVK
ncbi:MAG: hypothetical protein ABF652_23030 [Clostridium beijerinckii]|jgi:hypothetical protein